MRRAPVIRECSTPGCSTLTFGDVCLGCLQRQARAERTAAQDEGGSSSGDGALGPGSATAAEDASNSILSA